MPQVINTNVASLNSQRSLNMSQTSLATSLQRLSSGLRINSAKDDAAGLAISDRMNAQIRGINQATRNANDGISLAQTAEGDLDQIGNNLQRMRELAVQAGNATNSASDREALNLEVQSLAAEIDRVAQNSSFNGTKLLDGSFVAQNFQIGANGTTNDRLTITAIGSARTSALGGTGTSFAATKQGTATSDALSAGDLTLNGFQVGASSLGSGPGQSAASAFSIAAAINGTTTARSSPYDLWPDHRRRRWSSSCGGNAGHDHAEFQRRCGHRGQRWRGRRSRSCGWHNQPINHPDGQQHFFAERSDRQRRHQRPVGHRRRPGHGEQRSRFARLVPEPFRLGGFQPANDVGEPLGLAEPHRRCRLRVGNGQPDAGANPAAGGYGDARASQLAAAERALAAARLSARF
jgi:hypothetical protein